MGCRLLVKSRTRRCARWWFGRTRCTVEPPINELGLAGAVRGKVKRTAISYPRAPKPADVVGFAIWKRVRHTYAMIRACRMLPIVNDHLSSSNHSSAG